MSAAVFLVDPWGNSHKAYTESVFAISPAPETATSEVLLASLYRAVGFKGYAESDVPKAGREFLERSLKDEKVTKGHVTSDTWRTVLTGVLNSPKQKNQSTRRFLQLSPIIPDAALYSGSARLTGSPWNPGKLIANMIQLGCLSTSEADTLWHDLHVAISVSESDDIWARWLQDEFFIRRKGSVQWGETQLDHTNLLDPIDKAAMQYPAKQFVKDIAAVIDAKGSMTRRQWTTLMEAVLRIGTTSHVLWLCQVNRRLWQLTKRLLEQPDSPVPPRGNIQHDLFGDLGYVLSYGKQAQPAIRDLASAYLSSRIGINLVLRMLEDMGHSGTTLRSSIGIREFLCVVSSHRERLVARNVMEKFHELHDDQAITIGCKKGIGKNMFDFVRYVLAKRQPSDDAMRGYDQGYMLNKRGTSDRAPWILSMGPVAVLAMVHCCLAESKGPRSVGRFAAHMASFGIKVDLDDISLSDLGRTMRMLGLVLDSPDAESGMLLVPPFAMNTKKDAN
jgi:hypothetical protein